MDILEEQLSFFRRNASGCAFAALAAKAPAQYGWGRVICFPKVADIDQAINTAIQNEEVSTLSIIIPNIKKIDELIQFIGSLSTSDVLFTGQIDSYKDTICVGIRAKIGASVAWVSGFAPFDVLPKTRQAPYLELALRVKPRPHYDKMMKKPHEGVIHLADMQMHGMPDADFKRLWAASHAKVADLLEQEPDLRAAAKTTFAIPESLWLKYASNSFI